MLLVVRMLEYFKVTAFVGTVLFLVSGILPFITLTVLDTPVSVSLIDLYKTLGQNWQLRIGLVWAMVLYPVTLVLSFFSMFKRRVALIAGMLGLVCWICVLVALNTVPSMLQFTGIGVYVGIIAAIVLSITFFIKSSTSPQELAPNVTEAANEQGHQKTNSSFVLFLVQHLFSILSTTCIWPMCTVSFSPLMQRRLSLFLAC